MIRISFLGLALVSISFNALSNNDNQAARKIPSLPVSNWKVEASPGDSVELSQKDGLLCVNYDINVQKEHQIGHKTLNQQSFRILLKKAVPLDETFRRIIFEANGLDSHDPNSNKHILICPIIIDQNGEYLIYAPKKYPHLKSGGLGWSKWLSSDFYAGEAGGATQDVFEAEGGDQNAWPDGKLSFAGFQINVRKPEFGQRKGSVYLGDIEAAGIKIPSEFPFGYADSFFDKSGTYTLASSICNEFQGIPIREIEGRITYDAKKLSSKKQKITFPLGPIDNYWINYQITDPQGNVVAADFMRYEIVEPQKDALPKPIDTTVAPALGYMRINLPKKGSGVYERNEPFQVAIRLFPKGAKELELDWKLTPAMFNDSLDQGQMTIPFSDNKFQDICIKPKTADDRNAYRLELTLKKQGRVVDQQAYYLGYRSDMSKSHDRKGKLTNRHEIKKNTYNRTTYLPTPNGFEHEKDAVKHFRKFLQDSRQAASNITYMVDLANFEILPGVFDFSLLDEIMDAAADYGCKVTVRLAHADSKVTYRWPKYSRQYSYDGTEIDQHYYGAYAVTDPKTIKLWLDSYKALYDRYHNHTAFQGYYILKPGGEWTVMDQPWKGIIAGYSEAATFGFRDYLKKNMKLSLKDLNKRWGTNYSTWQDVRPPMPNLRSGAKPDLRMPWIDFNLFKANMGTKVWFPMAINSIRQYDPDRITITYGQPNQLKSLYGKLDYCHNGGNHYGNNAGQYIDAWEKGGIGYITEPHHPHRWAAYGDPADKGWVLDWSVWVMMSQAGGGAANLHIYYYPNPTLNLPMHYGGAYSYDRFEKYKPILEELLTLKLEEAPCQTAVLQDKYTLFAKHRTTFGARLDDLKRWFSLLDNDSVQYENFTEANEKNYKLLLPNILDEVIRLKNAETLNNLVRRGAKMIITANTGKYIPELGDKPYQFLKMLGIDPPKGNYVQAQRDVNAKNVETNPLFNKDESISFFTLADLRYDLQSDVVKKDFWKYPYRWIPQTDYFGYYPENKSTNGTILARFPEGGVALSLHKVGKGEVMVFWGTPDLRDSKLDGLMAKAENWAGATSPRRGSPIPHTLEGHSQKLKRHYALLYQETTGSYTQKLATVPDGKWFLTDIVSDQRLGTFTGKELRENGLTVTFVDGYSPLKIIRMMPLAQMQAKWIDKYRK